MTQLSPDNKRQFTKDVDSFEVVSASSVTEEAAPEDFGAHFLYSVYLDNLPRYGRGPGPERTLGRPKNKL
ncbi:hypothetical protein Ddc_03950 [Ditylenchus destructor]|nr:hypothetical protein Ddc_03950 [Ditylenchus destructor]